jgi:hypothetical protein
MTNAETSRRWLLIYELLQGSDASGAFSCLDVVTIDNSNTGRVVAAVLKAAQPIKQDGSSLGGTYVANNSAHKQERVRY